jgi:hypothetical protein
MGPSDADTAELVTQAPDVILAHGASTVRPLLQVTRTVPIVFPVAGDPVAAGFVDSLARPGGNATGFMTFEYNLSSKWLELLKQPNCRTCRKDRPSCAALTRTCSTSAGLSPGRTSGPVALPWGARARARDCRPQGSGARCWRRFHLGRMRFAAV